ncbi:MAG: radical SAM protein [Desulfamplus sp.]|nr:radical SAM protein [Desulfamplus sp.]
MFNTLSIPYCKITLNKRGADEYTKISFPLKYGIFSEIETSDAILQFNLNHEIVRAKSKDRQWLQPSEWLKRSMGNDWIYYSTGGYTGVFESIGEYYLPNLPYPTNSLIGGKPFDEPVVNQLLSSWHEIIGKSLDSVKNSRKSSHNSDLKRFSLDDRAKEHNLENYHNFIEFLESALKNTPQSLQKKTEALFNASGCRVTVMPPDARHVDYDIIPLIISDGCLYKCRFCRVKSDRPFAVRSFNQIKEQIEQLKEIYGHNIINYNSIFLGDHDGLNAGSSLDGGIDTIITAAEEAYKHFQFDKSYMKGANLFMFGSVGSLMNADHKLFELLNRLPYRSYINIGLESADQDTLDLIGKPLSALQVEEAFMEIQRINSLFDNVEITANFIMDENLPAGHYPAFLRLVRESIKRPKEKGAVYLSPLRINKPSREVLFEFNRLKTLSRLPTFLYIIQRL